MLEYLLNLKVDEYKITKIKQQTIKEIFNDIKQKSEIVIVKNIQQNRTFIFNNKTSDSDLQFMLNIINDCIIQKIYKLNQKATCIEVHQPKRFFKILKTIKKTIFKK